MALSRENVIRALGAYVNVFVTCTWFAYTALTLSSILLATVAVAVGHGAASVRFLRTSAYGHLLTAGVDLALAIRIQ